MLVEELRIENVRCFESETFRFTTHSTKRPFKWITFLSENGGGKSTALQSLGLLLAGPEGAQKLLPRPLGWLRDEDRQGKISTRIYQGEKDPGAHGKEKVRHAFGYSYSISGSKPLTLNNKLYTEPSIVPAGQSILTWLRENAFPSKGPGWFAVGYGAFRRLTRSSQIIVPSLEPQARFTNFSTQFDETEPLSVFERWLVYLDYRIAKAGDSIARKQKELGVEAINRLLPVDSRFDSVSPEGRILFRIGEQKVPTIALSDGFRSILALAGDLVWRWSNLLLACGICNGGRYKSDRFPGEDEGGPILNPCDDEPTEHFEFKYDYITKLANIYGKTSRGRTTEELLGLNRLDLRQHRSAFVRKLLALSDLARGDHPEAKELLLQAAQDEAEYAAFARALIPRQTYGS